MLTKHGSSYTEGTQNFYRGNERIGMDRAPKVTGSESLRLNSGSTIFRWKSRISFRNLTEEMKYDVEGADPDGLYKIKVYFAESYPMLEVINFNPASPEKARVLEAWRKPTDFPGNFQCRAFLWKQKRELMTTESRDPAQFSWRKDYEFQIWGGFLTEGKSVITGKDVDWMAIQSDHNPIGTGCYSEVVKYRKLDGHVAVKIGDPWNPYGISPSLLNEMACLTKLKHPNIIQVQDFVTGKNMNYSCIVMTLGGTSLHSAIHQCRTRGKERDYFTQMISAVAYLHTRGILHGDLKPSNFVVFPDGLRLIDFGISFSMFLNNDRNGESFSPNYRAPELWGRQIGSPGRQVGVPGSQKAPDIVISVHQKYTPAADIWALGCILGEMLDPSRELLFKHPGVMNSITSILGDQGGENTGTGFPFSLDPMTERFLRRFLVIDPKKRESLDVLSKDEWLKMSPVVCTADVNELMTDQFPCRITGREAATRNHVDMIKVVFREVQLWSGVNDRTMALGYAIHEYGEHRQDRASLAMAIRLASLLNYNSASRLTKEIIGEAVHGTAGEALISMINYHLNSVQFNFLSWTSYDILHHMAGGHMAGGHMAGDHMEGDSGDIGNQAHTLLQCTYFTHLNRAYYPREVAQFCWNLAHVDHIPTEKEKLMLEQAMVDWKALWWSECRFLELSTLAGCNRGADPRDLLLRLHRLL